MVILLLLRCVHGSNLRRVVGRKFGVSCDDRRLRVGHRRRRRHGLRRDRSLEEQPELPTFEIEKLSCLRLLTAGGRLENILINYFR